MHCHSIYIIYGSDGCPESPQKAQKGQEEWPRNMMMFAKSLPGGNEKICCKYGAHTDPLYEYQCYI